jgi:hypothetical protein
MGKNTMERQEFIIENLRFEIDEADKTVQLIESAKAELF